MGSASQHLAVRMKIIKKLDQLELCLEQKASVSLSIEISYYYAFLPPLNLFAFQF